MVSAGSSQVIAFAVLLAHPERSSVATQLIRGLDGPFRVPDGLKRTVTKASFEYAPVLS